MVHFLAPGLLWSQIRRGADNRPALRQVDVILDGTSQPEVEDFDPTSGH
jgi:hypothetical protein